MQTITIASVAERESPRLKLSQQQGGVFRFHALVKPAGSQCNLGCTYCYYLHKEDLLGQTSAPRMSESLLEMHIRQYIEAQTGPEVIFSWQGGEPTLMGLEFFRRVVEVQSRYRKPGQSIENDLQTNGILLDEAWCEFLKRERFLVGISIDGPGELHDLFRRSKGGKPSFELVMRAVRLLRKHSVEFSVLCVVNRVNARKPIDVYRFLRDEVRPRTIQFIPAVESVDFRAVAPHYWREADLPVLGTPRARPGTGDSVVTDWSVDPEDWGYFLSRIWDEWLKKDFGQVFIDQFENAISQMLGFGAQKCVSSEFCGKALALEHNGDLYSCDHFVYPEYRLGNITETHEGDLVFSRIQNEFALAKSKSLPAYCRSCLYLKLCWGECPRNRFIKAPDGQAGLNYLCSGLKRFYQKVLGSRAEVIRRMRTGGGF